VIFEDVLNETLDRLMLLGRTRRDAVTQALADFDGGDIGL
jgi:hypothetical protein